MTRDETVRRLKAAQALGGFSSIPRLASAADMPYKRVKSLFEGTDDARKIELRHIAETCGLPFEFFTADLHALAGDALVARVHGLEERLETIEYRLDLPPAEPEPDTKSGEGSHTRRANGTRGAEQ